MMCSRGETQTLLTRAAVGGGLSFDLAAEVGRAGLWLAIRGADGGGAVLAAIGDHKGRMSSPLVMDGDTAVFADARVAVCGMAAWECLAAKVARRVRLQGIGAPMLLLGYGGVAAADYGLKTHLDFSAGGVVEIEEDAKGTEAAAKAAELAGAAQPPQDGGIVINNKIWRQLKDLAARGYVAAASGRVADAGAGLLDND